MRQQSVGGIGASERIIEHRQRFIDFKNAQPMSDVCLNYAPFSSVCFTRAADEAPQILIYSLIGVIMAVI